jgi:hypothetical protein
MALANIGLFAAGALVGAAAARPAAAQMIGHLLKVTCTADHSVSRDVFKNCAMPVRAGTVDAVRPRRHCSDNLFCLRGERWTARLPEYTSACIAVAQLGRLVGSGERRLSGRVRRTGTSCGASGRPCCASRVCVCVCVCVSVSLSLFRFLFLGHCLYRVQVLNASTAG